MNKYEAMVIFSHTLDDTALEAKLENLRAEVAKLGGKAESFTRMGRRGFARPLKKREGGTFLLANLTLPPDKIQPLVDRLTRLQQDDAILRVQITRAPKPRKRPAPKAEPEAAT